MTSLDTKPAIPPLPPVPATPARRVGGLARAGLLIIAVFLVGFTVWAAVAPLESAAIAAGTVEVETRRKTVQHLEGGIIGAIEVRDGQTVRRGDVLLRLDDTKARTTLKMLRAKLWDGMAAEARLLAERQGAERVTYPEALLADAGEPTVKRIIAGQDRIFETRRTVTESKKQLIARRIRKYEEEIAGIRAQATAIGQRIGFVRQELAGVRKLYEQGYERAPRMLSLQGDLAELEGLKARLAADIARAQQSISEAELNILNVDNEQQQEISAELQKTRQEILQAREQIQQWLDVLKRTEIRAPEAGIVTALKVTTPGGVIAPGEPLLDIVPQQDRLVVIARVRPEDIDLVHRGLPAQVQLIPYKQRRVPPVDGSIVYVSADHMVDPASGQTYFEAKVHLDPAAAEGIDILPGMPAQVMIKTGESTVALYALSPVLDSFDRAFREQ